MDPILEEMQRAKDVQYGRFRSWTTYLCALVAAKDDEIATLKAQLAAIPITPEEFEVAARGGTWTVPSSDVRRGPGRPRKTEAANG